MSTGAIRNLALSLIMTSLVGLLALGGCGTVGTKVCNLNSGCCGPTSDACAVPQSLDANGLNGQISVFPIVNGGGVASSSGSVSGPANSLGMAALDNQFLYVSNPPSPVGGASSIDAWSIDPSTGALTALPGSPFSLGPVSFAAGLTLWRSYGADSCAVRLVPLVLFGGFYARQSVFRLDPISGAHGMHDFGLWERHPSDSIHQRDTRVGGRSKLSQWQSSICCDGELQCVTHDRHSAASELGCRFTATHQWD